MVKGFGQGPPIAAPVEVEIFGPDLNVLNELGEQVRALMSEVDGISQSIASISMGEPELNVVTDSDSLSYLGISLADLAAQMRINFSGITICINHSKDWNIQFLSFTNGNMFSSYVHNK